WAMTLVDRASAESLLGQHDAALADLKRALPILDEQLGMGSLAARQARTVLGEVHERRGDAADEARVAYTGALSPANDNPASASPTRDWLRARAMLGMARLAITTDPAKAAQLARDARAAIGASPQSVREQRLVEQALAIETKARPG
ncbi:MAG: hypothetical protein ABUL50_13470, partial [Rhizobacter sp.]